MKLTKDRLTGQEAHGFIKTSVHESSQKRSETKKAVRPKGFYTFLTEVKFGLLGTISCGEVTRKFLGE